MEVLVGFARDDRLAYATGRVRFGGDEYGGEGSLASPARKLVLPFRRGVVG